MHAWFLLLFTWLATELGTACSLQDLQRHSTGWMAMTQAPHGLRQDPAPNQSHPRRLGLHQCPPIRPLTAIFDSEEFVSHSRYSAPPPCPRHRMHLKPMLADKPGQWSLHHTRALRLQARWAQCGRPLGRNSDWIFSRWTKDTDFRCLYVQQTKVLVSQECSSTSSSPGTPPPPGAQQPARCWRSASARSCASSKHHARTGERVHYVHLLCATRLYPSPGSPKPPCTPQVLPQPPAVATNLACRHPGDFRCREGFHRSHLFWVILSSSGFSVSACEPAGTTPPHRHIQLPEPCIPLTHPDSFGSREAASPSHTTKVRRQDRVHSHCTHDADRSIHNIPPPVQGIPYPEHPVLIRINIFV